MAEGARILIVGAGGGRELDTLGASPLGFSLVGVDPSPDMLARARLYISAGDLGGRATLVQGVVRGLPADETFDAATALFVMHFLPDDGAKADFLDDIRRRLRRGAAYIHVDVCFDDAQAFERLRPVYERHAILGGVTPDTAAEVAARVGQLPILSEADLRTRLEQSGLRVVTPFYRGLWYAGFWAEAV
jgi:tRNA (cmo5U34)-methyltransferase